MNYKNLPKKRMGSGCLLLDNQGRLLLVKPTYKEGWEIPGGIVEDDESPKQCCLREIKEELSIDLSTIKLLLVDYNSYPEENNIEESIMFIFDGGIIDKNIINLDLKDHEECNFFDENEIEKKLSGQLLKRVKLALSCKKKNITLYADDQVV